MTITPCTFGIEEEFFLTDLASRNIVARRPLGFFRACQSAFGDRVSHELLQSQVELQTPVLADAASARSCLQDARQRLSQVAAGFGLGIVAAGTHPLAQWREQRTTDLPRYERLVDDFQIVAQRNLLCGLHVHVAVPAGVDRIVVMNRVLPDLPLLLALSASSPFWARKRTGLMSYRQAAYNEWPRTGIPDRFESEGGYRAFVEFLHQTGTLKNESFIWWAIRPSARFPTLELRITDACPRIEDVLCIAALFRAMVCDAVATPDDGARHNDMTRLVIEENRWRAMRFGRHAVFIDQQARRAVSAVDTLQQLGERVAPSLAQLNDSWSLSHAADILAVGTSADRQIACYEQSRAAGLPRRRALLAVVDGLLEETCQGENAVRSTRLPAGDGIRIRGDA